MYIEDLQFSHNRYVRGYTTPVGNPFPSFNDVMPRVVQNPDIQGTVPERAIGFNQLSIDRIYVNQFIQSANYVSGSTGWKINMAPGDGDVEFNNGIFRGALTAATIDIGGADATSMHVDIDGNMWLGAATFAAAPFTVSNAGAIGATSGLIAGWNIVTGYIYSLTSGTPTAAPSGGIVMASTNPAITTYEGTDKRTIMGYLSAGVFGFRGYATDGTTTIFELSNTLQQIAGWNFTNTTISSTGVSIVSGVSASIAFGTTVPTGPALGTGIYIDKTGLFGLDANTQNFKISATDGSITSIKGTIGTWNITSTVLRSGATDAASNVLLDPSNSLIRLGPTSGNYLSLDGANIRIRSSNYASGVAGSGFSLDSDLLEVGNIACRGLVRTYVLQKDVISVNAGSLLITPNADVLATDMTALDASTLTVKATATFSVGDRLRIKDGVDDEWLQVTNVASAPTYVVDRDKAAAYGPNANPAWKKGATVANYGASGQGGVYMTASETNAPYVSVFTHAGSPWSAMTSKVRLGKLDGITDTNFGALTGYGLWTDNIYLTGSINATAGYIGGAAGGWTIVAGKFYGGSGAAFSGMIQGTGTTKSFFAGATDNSGTAAKFYVTAAGDVTMTSATIAGYKLFDAIATKEGAGATTLVYYNNTTYTTIKAAIDAAQALGSSINIFVRKGTYTELQNIAVYTDASTWTIGITITGEDRANSIIAFGSQIGWKFAGKATISNMSFTGNGAEHGMLIVTSGTSGFSCSYTTITNTYSAAIFTTQGGCITILGGPTTGNQITITECKLKGGNFANPNGGWAVLSSSIYLAGSYGSTARVFITNNTIESNTIGIYVATGGSNFHILNNDITVLSDGSGQIGIDIAGTSLTQSKIAYNRISESSGAFGIALTYAIFLNGVTNTDAGDAKNEIIGNQINNGRIYAKGPGNLISNNIGKFGVVIVGLDFTVNGRLSQVLGNNMTGGDISITGSDILIEGNSVYSGQITDSADTNKKKNISIIGNLLRQSSGISLRLDTAANDSQEFVINDNLIEGNDNIAKAGAGITLGTLMNHTQVSNNTIYWYTTGITFNPNLNTSAITNLSIIGNNISDVTTGIDLYTSSTGGVNKLNLSDNTIYSGNIILRTFDANSVVHNNNMTGMLKINGAASGTITDNIIDASSAAAEGIYATGALGGIISNNTITTAAYDSIRVDATSELFVISDNKIYSGARGVYFAVDINDFTFTGNYIEKADASFALYVAGNCSYTAANNTKGGTIVGNTMLAKTTAGSVELIKVLGDCMHTVFSANRLWAGGASNYTIVIGGAATRNIFTSNISSNNIIAGTFDGVNIVGANTGNVNGNNIII